MSKLYLAYGANLNKSGMRFRCPTARPLGAVMIEDCELVFRGVADVQYAPGKTVPCGLWLINQGDEDAMDRFEGVRGDKGMYYKQYIPIRRNGRWTKALIYKMLDDGVSPPGAGYAGSIRQGYSDFGIDPKFLDDAIKFAEQHTAHTAQTLDRRQRQRHSDQKRNYHRTLVKMPEEAAQNRAKLLKAKRQEHTRPVLRLTPSAQGFVSNNEAPRLAQNDGVYTGDRRLSRPVRDVSRGSLFPEEDYADARRHAFCNKCGTVHHFRGACPDFAGT